MLYVFVDKPRLEDPHGHNQQHIVAEPTDIRRRSETNPGADGEGLLSALPTLRHLSGPSWRAQG